MVARVIHFGWDDCYRVQVLRSVGYEVRESHSLEGLRVDLQRDEHVDAIVVSEDNWQQTQQAAAMARQHSAAPLILFRRTANPIDQKLFDQVYSPLVPPEQWVSQTAELIAKSWALQKDSVSSEGEAKTRCRKCRLERGRLRAPDE